MDWSEASAIAIVGQAQAAGLSGEDLDDRLRAALQQDEALDNAIHTAVASLVNIGTAIQIVDDEDRDRPFFYEGRHRVTAMRDAGVHNTVVARFEPSDHT